MPSRILSVLLACLLTGCADFLPVRTVEVKIEVPVKCASGVRPVPPVNQYGALAKPDVDYALSALKSDRAAWQAYGTDLAAKTAGCWE